ncbi:aldo keto reductase [Lactobacillus selangorensis]|uniref:Aldo keto reductase n=1 Tax=Lactobacillus selangorensis TaxID=81857 RepID=A0A0R2FSN1_9LACO|nr:aldo/keto reductase [Lactobacillus selangorensis]KRN28124.1 aldo keto reductase [Lactobacillus selangorensis]KRN30999.1 aldo keto reductase [Lactobacillus selangorensis]
MEYQTFTNGVKIPMLGFGTYEIPSDTVGPLIQDALDTGYRHFDCAHLYGNEKAIGEALTKSNVARKDLFITSKVWNTDQGYDKTLKAFQQSLDDLQQDYLDLYLIHWPDAKNFQLTLDTWKALEKIYADGKARAIGVSNFSEDQLTELAKTATVKPMVNQIERHPYKVQKALGDFDAAHQIVNEGYSPLGHGHAMLNDPVLVDLAAKYHKTAAQVVLRWDIDTNFVVFPKSSKPERIKENFDIFDFKLEPADIDRINALDQDKHLNY